MKLIKRVFSALGRHWTLIWMALEIAFCVNASSTELRLTYGTLAIMWLNIWISDARLRTSERRAEMWKQHADDLGDMLWKQYDRASR